MTLAFGPPDAAFRAGYIQNPTDAKRARKVIGAAAEQRVIEVDAAAIMRRLEDVARLPLAAHERAAYAQQLSAARPDVEADRLPRWHPFVGKWIERNGQLRQLSETLFLGAKNRSVQLTGVNLERASVYSAL